MNSTTAFQGLSVYTRSIVSELSVYRYKYANKWPYLALFDHHFYGDEPSV